jgi:hypothetical protein
MVRSRKSATPDRTLEVGQTHWITAGAFLDRIAEIAATEKDGRVQVVIGHLKASIPSTSIGDRVDSTPAVE